MIVASGPVSPAARRTRASTNRSRRRPIARRREQQEGGAGERGPGLAAAVHTLPLGAHAAVAVTFTVNEFSRARFRLRSFTTFPDAIEVPREVDAPVIASAEGTVRSAEPIFSHQFLNVAVNCLLVPAVVVDGETVIVNGFGITVGMALADGAVKPIIMVATSAVTVIIPNFDGWVRRIGGSLLRSRRSTTALASSGGGHEPKGLGSFSHT